MKTEAEKWRDRYQLQRAAMDTVRRKLGCEPGESTIDAIERLRAEARAQRRASA